MYVNVLSDGLLLGTRPLATVCRPTPQQTMCLVQAYYAASSDHRILVQRYRRSGQTVDQAVTAAGLEDWYSTPDLFGNPSTGSSGPTPLSPFSLSHQLKWILKLPFTPVSTTSTSMPFSFFLFALFFSFFTCFRSLVNTELPSQSSGSAHGDAGTTRLNGIAVNHQHRRCLHQSELV